MQSVRRTLLVLLAGAAVLQLNAAPRKYLQKRWIPDRLSNEDYGMDSSSSGSYDTAAHNNYISYYWPDYTHGSGDNPDFSGMLYRANDKPTYASFDPVQQLYDVQTYSYMQSGNPYINGPNSNDNYDYSGSTYQGYVPGEEYAGRARQPQQPSYPAPSYGPPSYQNANPYLRVPTYSAPQSPTNYGYPSSPYTSTSYSYQAGPQQSYAQSRSTSQDVQEDVKADASKADASLEETKQNKQVDTAVQPEITDKATADENFKSEIMDKVTEDKDQMKMNPQQEMPESQPEEEVVDDNKEKTEQELSAVMPEATAVDESSQLDASMPTEQEKSPEEVADIKADELAKEDAVEERAHQVFPSYPDDDLSNPLDLVYPGSMSSPPPSGHSSYYDFPPQYGNRSPPNYYPPPPPQQYSRPPQYSRPQPNSYSNYGPPPPQQYPPSYNSYPDYGNQGSYASYPPPPQMNSYHHDQYQGPPSVYDSGYYPPTYPNRRNTPTPHRRVNRQSGGVYQIPYYG